MDALGSRRTSEKCEQLRSCWAASRLRTGRGSAGTGRVTGLRASRWPSSAVKVVMYAVSAVWHVTLSKHAGLFLHNYCAPLLREGTESRSETRRGRCKSRKTGVSGSRTRSDIFVRETWN